MEEFSKLISALASLAWPMVFAVLLFKLYDPIRNLVESAKGRKFSIKVAGNELTMEEASEQQRVIVNDLQSKMADLERRLASRDEKRGEELAQLSHQGQRLLWVDDNPRNNSYLVSALQERGSVIDIALSTAEGISMFKKNRYDFVVSDMGRPEGEHAGLDLTKQIKKLSPATPVFIFCGSWAARNLRDEALAAGASEITSSGTTLLSVLPADS